MHQVISCVNGDGSADLFRVSPEIVLGCLYRLLCFLGALHTGHIESSRTLSHGCFELKEPLHSIGAVRYRVHMSRLPVPLWNQLASTLFQNRNENLFHIRKPDVGELHIVELHAADLFQLFLDTPSAFDAVLQYLFDLCFGVVSIRIKQLRHAGNHLAHRNGIALVQAAA